MEFDEFSYYEVMDRLHVTMVNMETNLIEHDLVNHNEDYFNLIDEAQTKLMEVYQMLGREVYEKFKKEK